MLLIALFAVLQFVLQPLAAAVSCVMLQSEDGGCHCAHAVDEHEVPVASCCGLDEPAPDPEQDDDCDCFVSPQPDPLTFAEALDLQLFAVVGMLHVDSDAGAIRLVRGSVICCARIRAPRVGPDRLLLYQVFRI